MPTPIEQLEALRKLPSNWDGYSAAAPRAEVIDTAVQFLSDFPDIRRLPSPYICPTRIGGMLFAWEEGPHQLEIEFDSPEKGSLVFINRDTDESASGTFHPNGAA